MHQDDPLLRPFQLKHLALKNRIISTPHAPAYAEDGMPGLRYQLYHEEKARGGIGLTMFGGSSCIASDSSPVFGQLYVGDDRVIPYFQEFSARIHKHQCGLICQISHLGRRTVWNNGDWLPVIAPSRIREPAHRAFPKAMDQHEIDRTVQQYADAALRCREGGLDGCEILVHGHLPGQFLMAYSNDRTDKYGGSLENRVRYTLELLEAVRKRVGDDFIIGIRIEMTPDTSDELAQQECLQALKIIQHGGLVDYLSLNVGRIDSDFQLSRHLPAMWSPLAPWVAMAGLFKSELDLPILHACKVADLSSARHAIEANLVDLIGMTRAHIADPHIVNKLMAGEADRIRPCVGASYCIDRIYGEGEALCLHNVSTGREATMPHTIEPSLQRKKRIVVIGAGPAGLEAARVCALRGHSVTLIEASDKPGGQLRLAARASWRRDLIGIVDWYAAELNLLGVTIIWNTLADASFVIDLSPDVVIVACGGIPDTDFVPGGELAISVWDALDGASLAGDILIYDDHGQHQGVSCADYLSDQPDTRVELVTPDRHAAAEMGGINYPEYMRRLYNKRVVVTADYRLSRMEKNANRVSATFDNEFTGQSIVRLVDHLVVEHGTLPVDDLFEDIRALSVNDGITDATALLNGSPQGHKHSGDGRFELYRVGDAVASRNVHAAIYDSLRLAKDL
ncbi:N-methylproline demethylase [Chromatiales bacterium (ex Bugula neritina AB1)]|nr:N-methylproline demethylase [Chromatiales bacterium (ex Bugula neritina AB1)]